MNKIMLKNREGTEFEVPVRKAVSVDAPSARYGGFKQETVVLRKGSIRMKGSMPLPCDILLERDVPVKLRDGTTIYTDIFRPVDDKPHPAIVAFSPYGKEIGTQWLDDLPMRAGIKKSATSDLQKFEGPDPAYWCNHGYAVINPDVRGAYNSEGVVLFFGSQYGRDGYDLIEWAAEQSWSNGKLSMSGNSWLAISQWFIAAEQPPHLAAIAPWEGLCDCYREVATRGGVMMPEFVKFLMESFPSTENGGVENAMAAMNAYPTMNDYWRDKIAALENITVPAYVVASYTSPIHTNGTFEGFNRIASKEKWLRVHNTGEWDDYYNPAHVEELRQFFDHYMLGIDNGWEKMPSVRISVLNPGGKDIVGRPEAAFPLPRTQYKKLYIDTSDQTMKESPVLNKGCNSYNSDDNKHSIFYRYRFTEDTEIVGYWKLRLWVSAPDHDDMDLEIKVEKLNRLGKHFLTLNPMQAVAARGYMRASMRELDKSRSTEEFPYQTMEHEQKLNNGEIVPVDIQIWPMGLLFKKGEYLSVTVSAYKSPKPGGKAIPFGMKKLTVAKEGFTYMPKEKVEMMSLGEGDAVAPEDNTPIQKDHNHGRHIIYAGGQYDSFLYVPVVPKK